MSGAAGIGGRSSGRAGAPACRWLVSPAYDLGFFVASCALTYLFWWIYRSLADRQALPGPDAVIVTYFLFTALFDHPHIFQTLARTHADRGEFARRPRLYTWGLAAFVGVGWLLTALGFEAELIVFAALYGTWHIIRQHWGLIKIYKSLNDDRAPLDDWLDGGVFFTGMFACFVNDYGGLSGPVTIYGKLAAHFPGLPAEWGEALWNLFLVLLVVWGFRQTGRVMAGKSFNLPKVLLMGAALSTHYFVFFATATPFLVAEALETVYHNVQYQGWILHYQRRRFGARVLVPWLLAALAYGALVGTVEVFDLLDVAWAKYAFVPCAALVIFHYYVDGKIWRMRDDPELRRLLMPAKPEARN